MIMRMLGKLRRARLGPWLIPLVYAVAAISAGLLFPRFEHRFLHHVASDLTVNSAIAIYSSIASGMMVPKRCWRIQFADFAERSGLTPINIARPGKIPASVRRAR